jgi:hypothetical protein
MAKRGEPLPINQAMNRPRTKLGLDLSTWMETAAIALEVKQEFAAKEKMSAAASPLLG